jgi:diacylglycerol kinase (ATP)
MTSTAAPADVEVRERHARVGSIAVVANSTKKLGGGLPELRRVLEREGFSDPIWHEVAKSRDAPARVQQAVEAGAELVFVWGGDGMVQRCVGALANTEAAMAVLPAGTANLFAANLEIPTKLHEAVAIGLRGRRKKFDLGRMNGEAFAVFAGAGFEALMVKDASRKVKKRIGRVAYVWSGAKNLGAKSFKAKIVVDGKPWYEGTASCILFGNVRTISGGLELFDGARPDDGILDLGVVTADGRVEWLKTLAKTVRGHAQSSPFVHVTKGRSVKIKFNRKVLYEVDGGAREKKKTLRVEVEPGAVTVCVPESAA